MICGGASLSDKVALPLYGFKAFNHFIYLYLEQTLKVRVAQSMASKLTAGHSCTMQGYLLLSDTLKSEQ